MNRQTVTEKTTSNSVKFSINESGLFAAEYYIHKSDALEERRNYPVHLHERTEIYVLLDGKSSFVSGDQAYALSPYDAIIVPAGRLHHCLLNDVSKHSHACFWFETENACFNEIFKDKNFPVFIRFQDNSLDELKASIAYFYELQENEQKNSNLCMKMPLTDNRFDDLKTYSYFLRFLSALFESSKTSLAENKKNAEKATDVPPLLLRVLSDVDQNYASIATADELSHRHFVSASTLGRLFSKYLSVSPKAYLEAKKLSASVLCLKNGDCVNEAAAKTGFPDCSNYIRLFKTRFGVTPKRFAERYQKN